MHTKHILATLLATLLAFGSVCMAQPGGYTGTPQGGYTGAPQGMGGYTGPGPALTTVASARRSLDDTHVAIKGRIVNALGGEHYTFADHTGKVEVEIDAEVWQGQAIGPEDTVIIYGEVDQDWIRVKIDVKRLVKQ